MKYKPFSLIALMLTFAVTAAGAPVSDLYAYVVAGAGEKTITEPSAAEVIPEPAGDDITEGEGDYICYDCRLRFETEEEYVEHIKTEHPYKWEAIKSDYQPRLEGPGNALSEDVSDKKNDIKTVRIILTSGFIGTVGLILFLSIFDTGPEPCASGN